MNNRWYKKLLLLLTVGCMTVSMTGCSADSVLDKLLSVTDPKPDKKTEATKEDSSDKKDSAGEKEVEVAKPEFTTNLSGAVTYAVNAKASALTVEATTTDDGSITYQWYKSQTDTNGGGTLIDGATEASYTPPTDTEGTLLHMEQLVIPQKLLCQRMEPFRLKAKTRQVQVRYLANGYRIMMAGGMITGMELIREMHGNRLMENGMHLMKKVI